MNIIKENANEIIVCLFELLVGILLLINPVGFTTTIVVSFGIMLCVVGIINIIKYCRTEAQAAADGQSLFIGLACIVGGLFCMLKSDVITTFPFLTTVYGIGILIAGLNKTQWMFDGIRLGEEKWFLSAISAAVSIVCAVVIFANPFGKSVGIWIFTGISLILESVFDIISVIIQKND